MEQIGALQLNNPGNFKIQILPECIWRLHAHSSLHVPGARWKMEQIELKP
jgi:hypothetical protein